MRRLIPPDLQDLSLWPTVDPTALEGKRQEDLFNRIEAIQLYVSGTPLTKIEAITNVPRIQITRLIKHCIEPHQDGRIRGFRALIPFARSKSYQRIADIRLTTLKSHAGNSGAMTALLERHESLNSLLRQMLSSRIVFIGERGQLCGLHDAHRKFRDACRNLGLTARDYPLNHERQGLRGVGALQD